MAAARACARMQAWRVHSYGAELRLDSARVPALRAPDDILVAVHSTSINPLDVAMIGGYGARILNTLRALEGGGRDVEFPLVPGRDFAGEVVGAGPAARLRPGARVWGVVPPHRAGSLAQYVLVKDRWAGPAPVTLDTQRAGGALYAALSACAALRAAGVWPGGGTRPGRVLLLGLGGVGQAALQLLVHVGAMVVVGCSHELSALATSLGATHVLDRNSTDYDRLLEESGPYTAIVDTAGLGAPAASARRWRFERYVTLSSPLLRETDARGLAEGALVAAADLLRHEYSSRASAAAASSGPANVGSAPAFNAPLVNCAPRVRWAFFSPRADDIELLRRLADNKELEVQVECAYAWEEAADAFARAALGHARGKLVIDVAPR